MTYLLPSAIAALASCLTTIAVAQQGKPISVPSDPNARYFALDVKWTGSQLVEILTQREGKSGTSFSLRLVDCVKRQFKYLGEGDTQQEAMRRNSVGTAMGPLTAQSISTYVSDYACAQPRPSAR